jgi:ABC-type methionine transport system ATPase subunit
MGADMETVRVQLNFPLEQVKEPIIWHLAHDFGLKFSIRRASIDIHAGGWTVLELSGPREQIEAGLTWAQGRGVEVTSVGANGTDEWTVAPAPQHP